MLKKRGWQKGLGDAWVSFHLTDFVNLAWWVKFWKKFTFNGAQDVVRKPLVYSADCGACWSQGSHSNSAREISRAILLGVGWGGMSYWVYVTLSFHNWKRYDFRYSGAYFIYEFCVSHKCVLVGYSWHKKHIYRWYGTGITSLHFVAILHQPRPTDSADINTRLQLSDTSSTPPMHGGFLLICIYIYIYIDSITEGTIYGSN